MPYTVGVLLTVVNTNAATICLSYTLNGNAIILRRAKYSTSRNNIERGDEIVVLVVERCDTRATGSLSRPLPVFHVTISISYRYRSSESAYTCYTAMSDDQPHMARRARARLVRLRSTRACHARFCASISCAAHSDTRLATSGDDTSIAHRLGTGHV